MQWILAALIAAVVGFAVYYRWNVQRMVKRMSPERYLRPLDPAWSVGQQRDLGIASGVNLRDIGGYPAADRQRVRWGKVYRSGTLNELTPADAAQLAARGITLICDLRSNEEVADSPEDVARFGAAYKHLPINADRDSIRRLRAMIVRPESLSDLMRESYRDVMLERNASVIGSILREMTDPAALPILFHCTAGKDRTGVVAAVLLAVLGVPDEIIAADYALSNRFYHRFRDYVGTAVQKVRWMGLTVDSLQPLLIADGDMMREMLDSVRAKYGSIDNYLIQKAGLTEDDLRRLRQNLLETQN